MLGYATWKWFDQVCVCRVWNLNKLNNKSKFIHHGDMTVIQQPVISCWPAYGGFTLLSSIESMFFKVVQSVCHSAVTQQTHATEHHFHGLHLMRSQVPLLNIHPTPYGSSIVLLWKWIDKGLIYERQYSTAGQNIYLGSAIVDNNSHLPSI